MAGRAEDTPASQETALPFEGYAETLDSACSALADRLERLAVNGGPAEAATVAGIVRHFGEHWTDAFAAGITVATSRHATAGAVTSAAKKCLSVPPSPRRRPTMSDPLVTALHKNSCQREHLYCDGRCDDIGAALRASSDRLAIAASLLTEEDVAPEVDRHWLFRTDDGVFHCTADDWSLGPDDTIAEGDRLYPFTQHVAAAILVALRGESR